MLTKPLRLFACSCAILVWLCSCAVGPDYQKPDLTSLVPADWHWKPVDPQDASSKGPWWKIFKDPQLDNLETLAVTNNENLRAAVARVDQARASARLSRSQFFPELSLDPAVRRERTSGNLPTPIPFEVPSAHLNTFSVPLDLSYEVDLWGRVRRSFESTRAQARASVADYQNVLLTLTADVAIDYFLARSLDLEIVALRRAVELRNESAHVLTERFLAGTIPEIASAEAKTELATAKAQLINVIRQRAEIVHALALLCGKSASVFELPEAPLAGVPVTVPVGLPSALLERRPDIARAERILISKNALIGSAQAAYFPALRLTGQAGYLSAEAGSLFATDSRVWSIGPAVSLPLFNAGRTAAEVRQAKASDREALADYRQTVLTAFKEVEDSLAQIVLRAEEAAAQKDALLAAKRVTELGKARYDAGVGSYLEWIDAERGVLQHERATAELLGQRFVASVRLIKALGGGWNLAEDRVKP